MGLFRESYCPNHPGEVRGFCTACSHGKNKKARPVVVTGRGKATRVRQVDMRPTAKRTPAWPWQK